jgi:hypothetical protein
MNDTAQSMKAKDRQVRLGTRPLGGRHRYALPMTHPLPLRGEQAPDDAIVVLRAGVMSEASILQASGRMFDLYGLYGISVEGALDETVLQACRRSERLANYRQIRLSTFGRLRTAGFALLATFDNPHFTIVLPDLAELTVLRLDRCFDNPIPNPGRDHPG